MVEIKNRDGHTVAFAHDRDGIMCHHANEYATNGCTCPYECPCHRSGMKPCQLGVGVVLPAPVDLHTPRPFRYPSTTDDLMKFATEFFGKCQKIARERNQRYASPTRPFRNFELCGEFGFATRLSDKVSRLVTLTAPNNTIDDAGESIDDTCIDLCNYAMLLAAYRTYQRGEK